MSWYSYIKLGQDKGLWGQPVDPSETSQPVRTELPSFFSDHSLEMDIEYVENRQQLEQILEAYGAKSEVITFDGGANPLTVIEYNGELLALDDMGNMFDLTPLEEWMQGIQDYQLHEYVTLSDFNKEFWESPPRTVYHGTTEDNLKNIQIEGLQPRDETRGIGNRGTGSAIFTSLSHETASYSYDIVIEINVQAMRDDGYMPEVTMEGPIEEYETRSVLASMIGLENYESDQESGIDTETVIFHDSIPSKYLSARL